MAAILARIMPFVGALGRYALGQFAANLPALLTLGAGAVNAAIERLPIARPFKTLLKGVAAAMLATMAHAGSSPAKVSDSFVQRALTGESAAAHA